MKKILLLTIFSFILFSLPSCVFAYPIDTHAYLTDEIIDFYNKHFIDDKIPDELRDFLVDGSRREDDAPRWMNHFYDPVKDRGFSYDPAIDPGINFGTWEKSKDWAVDEDAQNKSLYKISTTIASILSAIQKFKIREITTETDFTWQKAIRYWVRGEKEEAMFILGHILHLVEDLGVPDHTRNDSHVGDSPYEDYASRFKLDNKDEELVGRLEDKDPIILQGLEMYFDEFAIYSNNNFYSKDTIGVQSGYKLPQPEIYPKKERGLYFAFSVKEKEQKPLFLIKSYREGKSVFQIPKKYISLNDPFNIVLEGYWSRLSTKVVQYGSGVIHLFFEEAEKAKNDPNFIAEEEKSFLASVIEAISSGFNDVENAMVSIFSDSVNSEIFKEQEKDVSNEAEKILKIRPEDELELEIPEEKAILEENLGAEPKISTKEEVSKVKEKEKVAEEKETKEQEEFSNPASSDTPSYLDACSFETNLSPTHHPIWINEVAWMGTKESYADEWIELRNSASNPVNISGWQLIDKDEKIQIYFPNITIPSKGFLLLERTDDNTVPEVLADVVYTGSLGNNGEGLRLFDDSCMLVDEVMANPDWPSGENESKKTMERNESGMGWHTSASEGGTPRSANSFPVVALSGGGGNAPASSEAQFHDLVINEIMYDAQGSDEGREWIEILNRSNSIVNLETWKVNENGVNHNLSVSQGSFSIAPGEFVIIADDPEKFMLDSPSFSGTLLKASMSLNNDGETITLKNGDLGIHAVTYTSSMGAQGNGNSLQWMEDTWVPGEPTPGSENIIIRALPASFSFSPFDPSVGDTISFFASSSEDGITRYEWNFGNGSYASSTNALQEYTYNNHGVFTVTLFVFDADGNRGEATSTLSVSESYGPIVPSSHVVISEFLFDAEENDETKEFIELYNPTTSTMSVTGWSLRDYVGNSTSSDSIAVFDESKGDKTTIPGRGFLLVGMNKYASSSYDGVASDISRSRSMLNGEEVVTINLLNEEEDIVDSVWYDENSISVPGVSLERKTVEGSLCKPSAEEREYSGNSCDRNTEEDFNERTIPNPQNSFSLPEPRQRLMAPVPLPSSSSLVRFVSSTMNLLFEWQEATSSDPTGQIRYVISGDEISTETTSTQYSMSIEEIGREYDFEMKAIDGDGYESPTSSYAISVPGFLSGLFLYEDTRMGKEEKFILDMYHNGLPFIPSIYGREAWQGLVFYLNEFHNVENENLTTGDDYIPSESSSVLGIRYPTCVNAGEGETRYSLIFPLKEEWCNPSGGLHASSMSFSLWEDDHLLVSLASTTENFSVSESDFITVAYYDLKETGGGRQDLEIVAMDKTKYYVGIVPERHSPELEGDMSIFFDEGSSAIQISLPTSTDRDTLDSDLRYELNFSDQGESLNPDLWNTTTTEKTYTRTVVPSDSFLIGVRSRDDFGNTSVVKTASWAYPETNFFIEQTEGGGWSDTFGTVNHSSAEPDSASFQSFTPLTDFSFDKVTVKLWQEQVSDQAAIRLSVLESNEVGRPDFSSILGLSVIENLLDPDSDVEQTFTFSTPISLVSSSTYWLVLDVASYSNASGYFRNRWRNAVMSGGDAYEGEAGRGYMNGSQDSCEGLSCSYTPNYMSGSADWYFRIGKEQES